MCGAVTGCYSQHQWLHGVEPLRDDRVHFILVVEVEPPANAGIAGRRQRHHPRARPSLTENRRRARCAAGKCGE